MNIKKFFSYIRYKRTLIIFSLLFITIFSVSFMLYGLPIAAVIYPSLLCIAIAAAVSVIQFRHTAASISACSKIEGFLDVTRDTLPDPDGVIAEELRKISLLLCDEAENRENIFNQKYANMIDYYTAWAHQIKTPIAAMRLILQNEDSNASRQLTVELNRIEHYAEMVMIYLRLDSDSTDYVFAEHDISDLVKECVKSFSSEFIIKGLSIKCNIPHTAVLTDKKWLMFVIEQLLSNALKYTEKGEISISLNEKDILSVSDSGIGIAPDDLPRIFEKGFTGKNGREYMRASGLGLYLCRMICNNLGHGISAESDVGVGTSIKLDLSRKKLEIE